MKNALTDPDYWGSYISYLVALLNQIDIPEELIKPIQKEINSIASTEASLTESAWGEDV